MVVCLHVTKVGMVAKFWVDCTVSKLESTLETRQLTKQALLVVRFPLRCPQLYLNAKVWWTVDVLLDKPTLPHFIILMVQPAVP